MKKRNLNRSLSISIVLVIVFVGIQFIPVNKEENENSNIVDFYQENQPPENIRKLIQTCFAFNSNDTKSPWDNNVAPFSWFTSKQNHWDNDNLTSQPYVNPFDSLHINIFKKDIDRLVQFTIVINHDAGFKMMIRHGEPSLSDFREGLQIKKLLDPNYINAMDSLLLPFTNHFAQTVDQPTEGQDTPPVSPETPENDPSKKTDIPPAESSEKLEPKFDPFSPESGDLHEKRLNKIMSILNDVAPGAYDRKEIENNLTNSDFRKGLQDMVSSKLYPYIAKKLFTNDRALYNRTYVKLFHRTAAHLSDNQIEKSIQAGKDLINHVSSFVDDPDNLNVPTAMAAYKKINKLQELSVTSPNYAFELLNDDDRFTDAYKFQLLSKINAELPMKYMVGSTIPTIFYYPGNLKSIVNKWMVEYRKGYEEYMVHVAKAYMALRPHLKMLQWKKQVENASVTNWNLVPVQKSPEFLNLSMWSKFSDETKHELLQQMINEVQNKMMPPKAYVLLHPEARLTDEQRTELINYLRSVDPAN